MEGNGCELNCVMFRKCQHCLKCHSNTGKVGSWTESEYLDFAWKWVNISSSVSITTADSYLMSEAHDKFVISGPNRN